MFQWTYSYTTSSGDNTNNGPHSLPAGRSVSLDLQNGEHSSPSEDLDIVQERRRRISVPNQQQETIQWFLFRKNSAISYRLPTHEPVLVGSGTECDIVIQSPSVEKRHAALAFEPASNCFTVKDLNSTNGTFVNKRRISADHPETISNLDLLRFGYDIRFIQDEENPSASLTTARNGLTSSSSSSGPSSLPTYYGSGSQQSTKPSIFRDAQRDNTSTSSSSGSSTLFKGSTQLPPKGYVPRKSLLTVTKSDPGGGIEDTERLRNNSLSSPGVSVGGVGGSSGVFSDRLFRRNSTSCGGGGGANSSFHDFPTGNNIDRGDRSLFQSGGQGQSALMQQGGVSGARSGTSGVCSPSLTLDSGRGSSSVPSSPAKEMSPVQMMAAAATTTASNSVGGASVVAGATSSSSSHNASPVFARKLSRPMEYLLGQHSAADDGKSLSLEEPGFVPDPPQSGPNSGNFTSYCSDYGGGSYGNQMRDEKNNNLHHHHLHGLPSDSVLGGGECEILQITEDFDNDDSGIIARKDSLEEVDRNTTTTDPVERDGRNKKPQFIVGGDIMQPDLNVPNEVFGPLSHAEILNRNLSSTNSNSSSSANLNSQQSTGGKQGNKPVDSCSANSTPTHRARARSSSGGEGSNRSTPLSALYGTPAWWPDSPPPEENCCPPPPVSSSTASPFKKPYLLNNNNNNHSVYIANSLAAVATSRQQLKENSSSSSLTDHVKDLSLESGLSQQSQSSQSPLPMGGRQGEMSTEVKKPMPMAFTIDFSDSEAGAAASSEAAEAKKAALAERLNKFAPRHRRNASLTKGDDVVGGSSKDGEPITTSTTASTKPVKSTNSLGRAHSQQRQSSATALTGGESSSSAKCASLPKKLGSKHPSGGSSSTNNNDSGLRSLSPETISSTTSSSSRSRPVAAESKSVSVTVNTPKLTSSSRVDNNSSSSSMTRKNKNLQSRIGTPATRKSPLSDGLRSTYQNENKGRRATSVPLNDLSKETTAKASVAPTTTQAVDKEDTVSEAGTYTVEKEAPEVLNARENIEDVFGLNDDLDKENNLDSVVTEQSKSFSAEPGTKDWIQQWAELAAQQHQQKQRPELPETQYFLRETETLVTAIQERVSKHMKAGGGAALDYDVTGGSESDDDDEPTLSHHTPVKTQSQHSTPTNTNSKRPPSRTSPFHRESSVLSDSGYGAIGYASDSSNEGSRRGDLIGHGIGNKMNRAFNIRRSRVGYDSETAADQLHLINQQSMTMPLNSTRGISPKPQMNGGKYGNNVSGRSGLVGAAAAAAPGVNTSSPSLFSRNDGGRYSLRMPKSRTPPAQMPPTSSRSTQNSSYPHSGGGDAHGRVMMNGHKSETHSSQPTSGNSKKFNAGSGKPGNSGGQKKQGNRSNSTLTAKEVELANWKRRKNYDPMKAAAEGKKNKKTNGVASGVESGLEETPQLPPIASSPKVNRREAMMTKSLSFHQESYSPKCASEDEDMIYIVDEMDSSHSNSPNHLGMTRSYHEDVMYYGMPGSSSMRQKNKLEALDNLVIATIHSLSNKVRTSSRQLLEKLHTQHADDENGALLEEMISQLKELEQPTNNASPNKSPSRELSGTLKNLKKLEQVVLVLDKVLCDGFESDINA